MDHESETDSVVTSLARTFRIFRKRGCDLNLVPETICSLPFTQPPSLSCFSICCSDVSYPSKMKRDKFALVKKKKLSKMCGFPQGTLTVEAGTLFSYPHSGAKQRHTSMLVPSLCSTLNRKGKSILVNPHLHLVLVCKVL